MPEERGSVHHVCPWYHAYLFDNPLRHLIHNPGKILSPYVKQGMAVLDIGCGMGLVSLGMAELVKPGGRVISLDIQPQMLRILKRRARRSDLSHIIETRLIHADRLGLIETADFILCFWMVHEIQDPEGFFNELLRIINPAGRILITEPPIHVTSEEFEKTIRTALKNGFCEESRPDISLCRAVLLSKCITDRSASIQGQEPCTLEYKVTFRNLESGIILAPFDGARSHAAAANP